MKKVLSLVLFLTIIVMSFTIVAKAEIVNADDYMWIYNQDPSGMWANTNLNTSDKPRTLSTSGCGIYTIAHVIQWLTGDHRNSSNGGTLLNDLIRVSNRPWEGSLSKYDTYMLPLGIVKGTKPQTRDAFVSFFDKGGVIIGNPPGHYDLAIGYSWHDINGDGIPELLIHMIDSRMDATIWKWNDTYKRYDFRGYHAYDFSTYSQITSDVKK